MRSIVIVCLVLLAAGPALAQQEDEELAKQTQNPIANLISVPLQNNFNFGVGPEDDLQYLLNIQPVVLMPDREVLPEIHDRFPPPDGRPRSFWGASFCLASSIGVPDAL